MSKSKIGASSAAKLEKSVRYRGWFSQISICLGKLFRMFIFQNDWKVLPMATAISAMVSMVVQPFMFLNMEDTLLGAFALSCVSIWNGCFNSIQVICRERDIVKREHRSGMHITSYIAAHMIYQAFLCAMQTALMTYVCYFLGVHFPKQGLITPWFLLDFAIAIFLITYASDMLGLFISSFVRSTTLAMTLMPFILLFQLVFSGGFFALPAWSQPLSDITISRCGMRTICGLAGYNDLPAVLAWNTLYRMRDTTIEKSMTVDEFRSALRSEFFQKRFREAEAPNGVTLDKVINILLDGDALDSFGDEEMDFSFTIRELLQAAGEKEVRHYIQEASREASYTADYDHTVPNISLCWVLLGCFSLAFAGLSVVSLSFVDRDKR